MYSSDYDSEFNESEEEKEKLLYIQLYFGSEDKTNPDLKKASDFSARVLPEITSNLSQPVLLADSDLIVGSNISKKVIKSSGIKVCSDKVTATSDSNFSSVKLSNVSNTVLNKLSNCFSNTISGYEKNISARGNQSSQKSANNAVENASLKSNQIFSKHKYDEITEKVSVTSKANVNITSNKICNNSDSLPLQKRKFFKLKTKAKNKNKKMPANSVSCLNNEKKRMRTFSHSSIESISGKEPLDNLYCNYFSDEELLPTINEKSCLEALVPPSLNAFEENDSNEVESRWSINFSEQHSRLNKLNSVGYSSEKEVCVLPPPPPPRPLATVTIESFDSGSERITVTDLKQKKKLIRKKQPAILSTKINACKHLIVLSSGTESDSDLEFLEASKGRTRLVFNVQLGVKPAFTKSKKKKNLLKPTKSQAVFSKDRPVTKKRPTCSKWTPEMASLYDSDISDEFSVEDIHQTQSDSKKKWKICYEDRCFNKTRQKRFRYFRERCLRCKEYGHTIKKCPRVPHCLYCGSASHVNVGQCPHKCCLRCGGNPHSVCDLTNNQRKCSECGNYGHDKTLCPDLWRRFHATTSGSVPVVPPSSNETDLRPRYCWHCARRGHYGHECRLSINSRYTPISTQIFSYDVPLTGKSSVPLRKKETDRDSADDVQIIKHTRGDISTGSVSSHRKKDLGNSLYKWTNQKKSDLILREPPDEVNISKAFLKSKTAVDDTKHECYDANVLNDNNVKMSYKVGTYHKSEQAVNIQQSITLGKNLGKKLWGKKSRGIWKLIEKRSHTQIDCSKSKRSLLVSGDAESVRAAVELVRIALLKQSAKEHLDLVTEAQTKTELQKVQPSETIEDTNKLSYFKHLAPHLPQTSTKASSAIASLLHIPASWNSGNGFKVLRNVIEFFKQTGVPKKIDKKTKAGQLMRNNVQLLSRLVKVYADSGCDVSKLKAFKKGLIKHPETINQSLWSHICLRYEDIANPKPQKVPSLLRKANEILADFELRQSLENKKNKTKTKNRNKSKKNKLWKRTFDNVKNMENQDRK